MNSVMSQNMMRKPVRLMRNEPNAPKKQNGKHSFTSEVGDIMAWVSVHDNVIGGKLREFAKEINCTQEEALGILVSLWLWGLKNADKEGRLMSADRDDVLEAFSVKLIGKLADVDIINALVKTRWMDEQDTGILYIHDWEQWQEQWYKAMERREKDAKRKAESRKAQKNCIENTGISPQEDESNQEIPNEQVSSEVNDVPKIPKEPEYPVPLEVFWEAYPKKVGKGEAYKKYRARKNDGYSDAELLEAAKVYADQCKKLKTDKQYIKHPKTFLSDSMPFRDFLQRKMQDGDDGAPSANSGNPYKEWGDFPE